MTTLTGQDVAGIYSLFLYKRNIEPTVKSRHILPRGIFDSFVALTPWRGDAHLCAFSSVQRARALTHKKPKTKRVYAQKQTKEVFL